MTLKSGKLERGPMIIGFFIDITAQCQQLLNNTRLPWKTRIMNQIPPAFRVRIHKILNIIIKFPKLPWSLELLNSSLQTLQISCLTTFDRKITEVLGIFLFLYFFSSVYISYYYFVYDAKSYRVWVGGVILAYIGIVKTYVVFSLAYV